MPAHDCTFYRQLLLKPIYGVLRPFSAYSFGDQLGLVRGTKSKIEDGYATGTLPLRGVAVGDLAGAQRLRLQLVLEFRKISLLLISDGMLQDGV